MELKRIKIILKNTVCTGISASADEYCAVTIEQVWRRGGSWPRSPPRPPGASFVALCKYNQSEIEVLAEGEDTARPDEAAPPQEL